MNSGTKDKTEGNFHELKGKLKETLGHVIKDSGLETEGKSENIAGKVQKKVGEIKDVFKE